MFYFLPLFPEDYNFPFVCPCLKKQKKTKKNSSFLLLGGSLITKSCLNLCDRMDYNPQGSSVHGISQTKLLE